mmetsp:Transcript_69119/g.184248  ORF Transcript_69119/g.184248 Transcript_69119/m.184248 type:complete len:359 (+) Transcript_69119:204-1280(+)
MRYEPLVADFALHDPAVFQSSRVLTRRQRGLQCLSRRQHRLHLHAGLLALLHLDHHHRDGVRPPVARVLLRPVHPVVNHVVGVGSVGGDDGNAPLAPDQGGVAVGHVPTDNGGDSGGLQKCHYLILEIPGHPVVHPRLHHHGWVVPHHRHAVRPRRQRPHAVLEQPLALRAPIPYGAPRPVVPGRPRLHALHQVPELLGVPLVHGLHPGFHRRLHGVGLLPAPGVAPSRVRLRGHAAGILRGDRPVQEQDPRVQHSDLTQAQVLVHRGSGLHHVFERGEDILVRATLPASLKLLPPVLKGIRCARPHGLPQHPLQPFHTGPRLSSRCLELLRSYLSIATEKGPIDPRVLLIVQLMEQA